MTVAHALEDPLLAYAAEDLAKNPSLVRILNLQGANKNDSVARDAYKASEEAAQSGSAFAMCICSRFARAGFGTAQSNGDAFSWAQRAAAAEFVPGHYELGKCYEEGMGVPADLERARRHYELAAEGGFGFAACHLATMYHSGKFGDAARAKALQHAERAYELREPLAPITLAIWYEHGDGVIRNEKEALKWYVRAVELGNFAASLRLSAAYSRGELGLQKDLDMARKYEAMSFSQLP